MTLLQQLEHELQRVQNQLRRLTRERTILAEQVTRLRTGARPQEVCAALELALGISVELYLLDSQGAEPNSPPPQSDQLPARPGDRTGRRADR